MHKGVITILVVEFFPGQLDFVGSFFARIKRYFMYIIKAS